MKRGLIALFVLATLVLSISGVFAEDANYDLSKSAVSQTASSSEETPVSKELIDENCSKMKKEINAVDSMAQARYDETVKPCKLIYLFIGSSSNSGIIHNFPPQNKDLIVPASTGILYTFQPNNRLNLTIHGDISNFSYGGEPFAFKKMGDYMIFEKDRKIMYTSGSTLLGRVKEGMKEFWAKYITKKEYGPIAYSSIPKTPSTSVAQNPNEPIQTPNEAQPIPIPITRDAWVTECILQYSPAITPNAARREELSQLCQNEYDSQSSN